ncbi:MAG: alginate export family protein, partial [Cyclobacteriaceae bacterium]
YDFVNTNSDLTQHNLTTVGLLPKYKLSDKLSLAGSAYLQWGEFVNNNSVGAASAAYLLNLDATYKADGKSVTLGFDMVSGDNGSSTKVTNAFNPMFGTHHKFYGLMDFFYVGDANAGGLTNIYLKGVMKASDKLTLVAQLHEFLVQRDFTNAKNGASFQAGDAFGTELDLVAKYKVGAGFGLVAGYSQLFSAPALEKGRYGISASSKNFNNWMWLQANVTF